MAALLALAACGSPSEQPAPGPDRERLRDAIADAGETADNCLLLVWDRQEARDVEFDRANDRARGGAISCATGTSASRFQSALDEIRLAAEGHNREAVLANVGIPLLYIDAEGRRRQLADREQVGALFNEVFSPEMLALLARVDLSDMTVVEERGAFFELGALWLVVDEPGGRPRIVTVNAQALDEAAAAARRAAEAGHGVPVPLDGP